MASKKTSMFTLTERLTIDQATTDTFATIDLGSYVDVGDRQAIQIHSVDFIFQSTVPGGYLPGAIGGNQAVHVQVTDLNRGELVFTDDRALVASAALYIDSTSGLNNESDMYPDNYGKGADDGRYVVNDQLYITGHVTGLVVNEAVNVTVRVNASIVSLTAKDFMAIAIQSTAADN